MLIIICCYYYYLFISMLPPPNPSLQSSSPLPPPLHHWEGAPSRSTLSPFPGASSLYKTRHRQGRPMLHMCWRPQTGPCKLFGWWLTLWEFPGVWRLVDTLGWGCQLLQSFPYLFHRGSQPQFNAWLRSICIYLSQPLAEPIRGQVC